MGDYKTARSRLQAICNHVFTKKWKYAEELIATAVSPRPPTRARQLGFPLMRFLPTLAASHREPGKGHPGRG